MYHMNITEENTLKMSITRRKWMIDRFIQQKQKENEAIEKARKKAKTK